MFLSPFLCGIQPAQVCSGGRLMLPPLWGKLTLDPNCGILFCSLVLGNSSDSPIKLHPATQLYQKLMNNLAFSHSFILMICFAPRKGGRVLFIGCPFKVPTFDAFGQKINMEAIRNTLREKQWIHMEWLRLLERPGTGLGPGPWSVCRTFQSWQLVKAYIGPGRFLWWCTWLLKRWPGGKNLGKATQKQ